MENTCENRESSESTSVYYTKLELLSAKEIKTFVHVHCALIAAVFVSELLVVVLSNTIWIALRDFRKPDGSLIRLRDADIPSTLTWLNDVMDIVLFFVQTVILVSFSLQTFSRKDDTTAEQKWVLVMLIGCVLYMIPFFEVLQIHDVLLKSNTSWEHTSTFKYVEPTLTVTRQFGMSLRYLFYFWASVHSYRLVDKEPGFRFLAPKVLLLLVDTILRAVSEILFQVYAAEIPFASLLGMIKLYGSAGQWNFNGVLFISLFTLLELFCFGLIAFESHKTFTKLRTYNFVKHRSKQVGFRFFVVQNMRYQLIHDLTFSIFLLAEPNSHAIQKLFDPENPRDDFGIEHLQSGHHLLIMTHAAIEAYVRLPADSPGLFLFFIPCGNSQSSPTTRKKPISYRLQEVENEENDHSSCFFLKTHISMFNMSWYVYWYDRPGNTGVLFSRLFSLYERDIFVDPQSDTHAVIISSISRIIISFRGTTSLQNMRTDINMLFVQLRDLIPSQNCEQRQPQTMYHWPMAKVHRGFAGAYQSLASNIIDRIRILYAESDRPVFLTGHSLGGALAIICSLDLHVVLDIPTAKIIVSAFGSPRIGNFSFQKVYNSTLHQTWRISIQRDLVTKLPKLGYYHVGKLAMITDSGDIFLDPNSLFNIFSSGRSRFAYHTKPCYQVALQSWCRQAHGEGFEPDFWFHVDEHDPALGFIVSRNSTTTA